MTRVPCRVCGKPYDGSTHCSVSICQACAVFFRRSKTWDSIPNCKTGRDDCNLSRAGKIKCSSCRYHKCIEVGLMPKKNERTSKCGREDQQPSTRAMQENNMNIKVHFLVADSMPTMRRFAHFYAQCMNNTTNIEFAMLQADGARLTELPGNRRMARITHSISDRMIPFGIAEFGKLMNGAFPAYTAMEKSHQETLTYLLMFPLFEMIASFRSLRVFNDVNCKKVLCTEALYADLADATGYIEPTMFANYMDYKAVVDYMSVWWRRFLNTTHRVMHRIQITDVEFLAVCALTIWDEEKFGDNKQLRLVAERHRRLIYNDLHYYYINILHMDNYVERVMNFKELDKITKNSSYAVKELFYFLRTFNCYTTSEGLCEASLKMINAYESIQAH